MNKTEKTWTKNCPNCGRIQRYTTKKELNNAARLVRLCYSCSSSGRPRSEEYRKKISDALVGRKLSSEHRNRIKRGMENYLKDHRDEYSKRLSSVHKGRPSHRKGKTLMKTWRMKIRNGLLTMSPRLKRKVIDGNKNRKMSDETRRKMRLARIRYIERVKFSGGQMRPSFSFQACQYFDVLNGQNNWNLQHALNGGEYYLKDLGYWVDAYDKNRNIVVEYDEGQHNRKKEADIRRMTEIRSHLGCRFFRYDAVSEELKEM